VLPVPQALRDLKAVRAPRVVLAEGKYLRHFYSRSVTSPLMPGSRISSLRLFPYWGADSIETKVGGEFPSPNASISANSIVLEFSYTEWPAIYIGGMHPQRESRCA
jgi:hypothetical protein